MVKEGEKMYGWFSCKATEVANTNTYLNPAGNQVWVTCISDSPTVHPTRWDNEIFVGEVVGSPVQIVEPLGFRNRTKKRGW